MGIHYNKIAGDGLSAASAAQSARAIKASYPSSTSGLYWLKNSSVNGGAAFQAYCDMETDGGGWMLLVQNATIGGATKMNYTNFSLLNQSSPPIASSRANVTKSYSILAWADYLKNPNRPFEYMIEAYERNRYGGIWIANDKTYTFNQTANTATNITLKTKFDSWAYQDDSIEARMPWLDAASTTNAMLTTSASSSSNWWGTIIEASSSFSPAPWINTTAPAGSAGVTDNPGVIWYWMRGL